MGMSDFTGTQAGCAREEGDKIDHLRKELSRYVKDSRNHKKAKRVLSRESRRISNKQENDEWRIARSITAGIACLAIEDPTRLNFAAMRAKGGNRKKHESHHGILQARRTEGQDPPEDGGARRNCTPGGSAQHQPAVSQVLLCMQGVAEL